jgi:PAS domain S-box-containing protein
MNRNDIIRMPDWASELACRVLRCAFSDKSLNQALGEALAIIFRCPELGLAPGAAVYVSDGKALQQSLLFHLDVEWHRIPRFIQPNEGASVRCELQQGKQSCFVSLIDRDEGEQIGTVMLLFADAKEPQSEILSILIQIAHDLARLIVGKRKAALNSQLADIAGISENEIYLFDGDSLEIFKANHSAQIKTGYRPDQIMRMTPADLIEGMDIEQYRRLLDPLISGKRECVVFDARRLRRDGTVYDSTVKIWKLQSSDSATFAELVIDQSDQKKLLGLLHAAFNAFPGGIAVLDENLRLTFANHRFYELVDIPPEVCPIGCSYVDVLRYNAARGDYGPGDVEEQAQQRAEHARLFISISFLRERADGTVLEISTSPLATGGGVVTYMDVTVRRRAEQELIRHRDWLEEAVRLRTEELALQAEKLAQALEHEKYISALQRQFVAMTSHEFRTPLAIIDGAAQRMMRKSSGMPAEFVAEKTHQIRSAVARMVELMESFLTAGRLDGGMKLTIVDCALHDIVKQCARHQSDVSPNHRLHLDIDNLPRTVRGDALGLNQVFANLFSNAVKYSPKAPDIDIKGWEADGFAYLSVRDNGVGIDADELQKMFQLYFRARTSSGIAGTGIGLNLVKQVVDLHGGEIRVESEKDHGTLFTVKLPVAGPAQMQESGIEEGNERSVA